MNLGTKYSRILVLEAGGPSQSSTGGHDLLWRNLTVFDVPLGPSPPPFSTYFTVIEHKLLFAV